MQTQPIPKNAIVHLLPEADWEAAQAAGSYQAASLENEGFIHFSTPNQVLGVANAFYRGLTGLCLLWVDPDQLQAPLRWEPPAHPTPGDQPPSEDRFPHLYGPLNLEAVIRAVPFNADADGVFRKVPTG